MMALPGKKEVSTLLITSMALAMSTNKLNASVRYHSLPIERPKLFETDKTTIVRVRPPKKQKKVFSLYLIHAEWKSSHWP